MEMNKMTIENILAFGVFVNIIGWAIALSERERNRSVAEQILAIHRVNSRIYYEKACMGGYEAAQETQKKVNVN
jgi:hypothetical protein